MEISTKVRSLITTSTGRGPIFGPEDKSMKAFSKKISDQDTVIITIQMEIAMKGSI
jgi:hypothetical protein